jgi:hypothetical protein
MSNAARAAVDCGGQVAEIATADVTSSTLIPFLFATISGFVRRKRIACHIIQLTRLRVIPVVLFPLATSAVSLAQAPPRMPIPNDYWDSIKTRRQSLRSLTMRSRCPHGSWSTRIRPMAK